jgi:sugar-specific transcriptional regulator TrmB
MTELTKERALIDFGLSEYEARVYLALLEMPGAAASTLARQARVPRTRVYDVLKGLLERGFVSRTSGKRLTYRPVPPAQAVDALVAEERERRSRQDASLSRLTEALQKVYAGAEAAAGPEEFVEIIKNPLQIMARANSLCGRAESRVLSFSKPPYVMGPPPEGDPEEVFDAAAEAVKRDVRFRAVYEVPAEGDPVLMQVAEHCVRQGEEIRLASYVPMKMIVRDGREVIISLEDPATAETTVTSLVIEHRALAEACEILFEKVWVTAAPIKTGAGEKGGRGKGKKKRPAG